MARRKEYPEEFEAFWTRYPRKVAKGYAARVWDKATAGMTAEQKQNIAFSAGRMAMLWKRLGREMRYIPHPSTWLSQRRWEAEQWT